MKMVGQNNLPSRTVRPQLRIHPRRARKTRTVLLAETGSAEERRILKVLSTKKTEEGNDASMWWVIGSAAVLLAALIFAKFYPFRKRW